MNNQTVSFDDEKLILVDEDDNILGYKDKLESHRGDGVLHRAFSVFIFNDAGDVLMQKRHPDKMLWGNFWSNSCCSHPRQGESYEIATQRRIKEELGITTPLVFLYQFQYQAKFKNIGSENELCSVYVGRSNDPITVNPTEIADWKFIPPEELDADVDANPDQYTPWFKMEWQQIRRHYTAIIHNL